MSRKFEDIMRPGFSRHAVSPVSGPPDAVRWVNLLSALCFTCFCTLMSHPQSWGDGFFFFMFFGMIFGPVIFLMTSGFASMCGGRTAWWVSVACFALVTLISVYFLYRSYGLGWL